MLKIIPSILTNDPNEARKLLSRCEGVVDRVSIDIIDGKFADNKTVDPSIFSDIDTELKIDYQLMVIEPVKWINKCLYGQADRIIGHVEHMRDQVEFVEEMQRLTVSVGLGLDLPTSVSKIDRTIINDLDVVLIMSVPAGFGGQEFDESVISKFEELDRIRAMDNTPFLIQDDGGVKLEYIDDLRLAGVDEVSVGRRLFKGDLKENIEKFKNSL